MLASYNAKSRALVYAHFNVTAPTCFAGKRATHFSGASITMLSSLRTILLQQDDEEEH